MNLHRQTLLHTFQHFLLKRMTKISNGVNRQCNSCKKTKSLDDFYPDAKRKYHTCRDCTSLCLICGRERNLVVDHEHKSGKVRGLLCSGCNTGLGLFDENPVLFDKAKEYVS